MRSSIIRPFTYRADCANVSVEPATLNEGCKTAATTYDIKELQSEYHKAAEWFVEEARKGNRPKFSHFNKHIRRILNGEFKLSECGAGRAYITLSPLGEIYSCHREGQTQIGHLNYGFDEEARAKWIDNRIYARECGECWARYICGGGCKYNSLDTGLSCRTPSPQECEFHKIWIKESLWIISELDYKTLDRLFGNDKKEKK